jgi:hypothetical protein
MRILAAKKKQEEENPEDEDDDDDEDEEEEELEVVGLFCLLFVYSSTSNFSAIWQLSPLPLMVANLDLCLALTTWDLGLSGLIRRTGTHVPQWDSNPQCKDHQKVVPVSTEHTMQH